MFASQTGFISMNSLSFTRKLLPRQPEDELLISPVTNLPKTNYNTVGSKVAHLTHLLTNGHKPQKGHHLEICLEAQMESTRPSDLACTAAKTQERRFEPAKNPV